MSRLGRSILDFFAPRRPKDLDDKPNSVTDDTGALANWLRRKPSDLLVERPRKRRRLSPSPERSDEEASRTSTPAVEEQPLPALCEVHDAGSTIVASSQVKRSSPLSSPSDVLTRFKTKDLSSEAPLDDRLAPALDSQGSLKRATQAPSIPSFTTLPRSTPSFGGKRTTINGEEMVMDSQGSDDSDDLIDLMDVFSKPKKSSDVPKERSRSHTSPPENGLNAQTSLGKRASTRLKQSERGSAAALERSKPAQTYKFSLDKIVKGSENTSRAESEVREHALKLEQQEKTWNKDDDVYALNEGYLASVVEHGSEEEGKAKRVAQAISRTDALEQTLVWHFFDTSATGNPRKSFPFSALSSQGWMVLLKDPARRQRLFVTGFVTRMAIIGRLLPVEVLDWLLSELCAETRDEMLYAYVAVLIASAQESRAFLTVARIQEVFGSLHAKREAVETQAPLCLQRASSELTRWIPPQLRWVLRCLQGFSRWFSHEVRSFVLHILARMLLDESIRYDCESQLLVGETISSLCDIADDEADFAFSSTGHMLFEAVQSPAMRERLISALPCHTSRTHLFRRRLAFAFALETPKYIEKSLTGRKLTDQVLLHLARSSLFRISLETDYKALTARFNMLNVAIDAGFSDFSWLRPAQECLVGQSDTESKDEQIEKEKKFNAGIDMLAQEILEIMARIVDCGMSNLRRTEAKAAAQRLQQRLEFAVRTKEKPAKDWFGLKDDTVRREFMQNWFQKAERESTEGERTADAGD